MSKENSGGQTGENRSTAASPNSAGDAAFQERRGFLTRTLAVAVGGIVGLFPFLVGLAVFLDPLRKRTAKANGDGFVKVASLDTLLVGKPRRFTVVDDRVDAWNLFPQEPVGAVYLLRRSNDDVLALNVVCPHAGCFVDYDRDREVYQCPCHNSSFEMTGEIHNQNSPSPRGLFALEIDPARLKKGEVWVKF